MFTDIIDNLRKETGTLALLGACAAVLLGGSAAVAILDGQATAQSPADDSIAVWVYPSGIVMPHPTDPDLVCVLARGHPTRPTELHCAGLPNV